MQHPNGSTAIVAHSGLVYWTHVTVSWTPLTPAGSESRRTQIWVIWTSSEPLSKVKWSENRSVVSDSLQPHGTYSRWNSPGKNTGVGSLSLLQGIFSTQGSNPGLLHCRWIIYQLRHKGSPRVLEWVAYSFSRGISQTQELNWGLLYCRQILYQLSYQGSPLSKGIFNYSD